MLNPEFIRLGNNRSAIRDLYEYGVHYEQEHGVGSVLDFSLGNPSVATPDEVVSLIKRLAAEDGVHDYTIAAGDLSVRKALADSLNRRFGGDFEPRHLYMTMGASAALTVVFGALTNGCDEIILLAPYFPEYTVFVQGAGARPVVVPMTEDFDPDLETLERAISPKTSAVVVNSPNNPSGKVYDRATIEAIASLLKRKSAEVGHPIYIVSDEPYREIVYDGEVTWVPSVYPDTIICYSWSKCLSLPGERIGYVAINPSAALADDLIPAVAGAARSLGYVCAGSTFQRVVGQLPDVVCDVSVYRTNRDLLYKGLTELGYHCLSPDGAFYLMVKSPWGSGEEFSARAKELGVLIVPGASFGAPQWVRIAYCVPRQRIEKALPLFASLLDGHKQ